MGGRLRQALRHGRGQALVFALLVAVTACAAAALPRAYGGWGDDALRATVADTSYADRLVTGTSGGLEIGGTPLNVLERMFDAEAARRGYDAYRDVLRAPVRTDPGSVAYGVVSTDASLVPESGLPQITPGKKPKATLAAQQDLAGHTKVVRGRLPGPDVEVSAGEDAAVEVALTQATARRMQLGVGDTFTLPGAGAKVTARVTGLVTPRDADGTWWRAGESLLAPRRVTEAAPPPSEPSYYWQFTALLDPGASAAVLRGDGGAQLRWSFPVPVDALGTGDVERLRGDLGSLESGPLGTRLNSAAGSDITTESPLGEILGQFAAERATLTPLLLTAGLGLGTTALAVLLLWGVLSAERRARETELLRARGASLAGIGRSLLAESACVGVPAAVVGAAAGCLLTDGAYGPALLAAAGVTVVAVAALPVRAALAARRPAAGRGDLLRVRLTRGRIIAELTTLVVVVAAVVALRRRGADATGGAGADPLLAAAPVLLALGVALLLLRLYPLPLRLLARPAARGSGPVAFLGLARAGRSPATAVLPLVTLLVALTVASFGGTVLSGVEAGRDRAALVRTGADARLEAVDALPAALQQRARDAAGVTGSAGAHVFGEARLIGTGNASSALAALVVVEPAAYAALATERGLGGYDPADLDGGKAGPLPALASPEVADEFSGQDVSVTVPGMGLEVRPVLTARETPATDAAAFLVVSRAALERAQPDVAGTALVRPNLLLLEGGSPDRAALEKLTEGEPEGTVVRFLADERATYAASQLQSGAQRLYVLGVAGAAAYSVLALLLTLVQTAPERVALLVRLRALGMPRRAGRRLVLAEALPLHLLTALAGALTALAAIPLLRPGVDLTTLAGIPGEDTLRLGVAPLWLAGPAVCLVVLAALALLLQASYAARRTTDHPQESV